MWPASVVAQQLTALPPWLASYPGASPTVRVSESMVQSAYTAPAVQLTDVVEHYRKIFVAAGLPFAANPDGIGTTIRGSSPECDVLIRLRGRLDGTFVDVYCSAPSKSAAASAPAPVIAGQQSDAPVSARRLSSTATPARPAPVQSTPGQAPQIPADLMERHKQLAAEMGIGRQHQDQPAPPLVWPSWLTHVQGAALLPQRGVDQSKDAMLSVRYTTNVPMTEIRDFYRDLLNAHEYRARSELSTGHTISGIQQNAYGSVEGSNYPDGAPGAHTVIRVTFDRSVLNGPITVILRFTTHEYIAKRGY